MWKANGSAVCRSLKRKLCVGRAIRDGEAAWLLGKWRIVQCSLPERLRQAFSKVSNQGSIRKAEKFQVPLAK